MSHEEPTGRLRWRREPHENGSITALQQEWRVTTGNHKARTVTTEWRDVPVECWA